MLKLLKLPLWKLVAGAFAVFALGSGALGWLRDRQDDAATRNCQGITLTVNDSTQAVCARLRADRSELLGLRKAAKAMNGRLVAGVEIRVKSDTLWMPAAPVPTDTLPNQARMATVADTTQDYQVTITALAPTYPGNLQIGYSVVTPVRTAEVGFVKTKGGYFAVVSGRGITTSKAFFTPERERPLALYAGAALTGNPIAPAFGADVRANTFLSLQYRTPKWATALEAGMDDRLYVGVRVQRKIF